MKPSLENTFLHVVSLALALVAVLPVSSAKSAPDVIECTLILDQETGAALVRTGTCDERFTPMSTFKVPLALMGYDAGVLKDRHTPRWDYDAKFDAPKRARKPVDPTTWELDSIVWYSQELTRKLGNKRFDAYVRKLGYGNADTKGNPGKGDGLTQSWLSSSLKISADEQAAFMRRLAARDLPVSGAAMDMTASIVPSFEAGDGWTVQGKTGSGSLRRKNGKLDPTRPIGWFVGWAEKHGRRIAFARLRIGVTRPTEPSGLALRATFLEELPALMRGK
jgi:beta-lactamase class D